MGNPRNPQAYGLRPPSSRIIVGPAVETIVTSMKPTRSTPRRPARMRVTVRRDGDACIVMKPLPRPPIRGPYLPFRERRPPQRQKEPIPDQKAMSSIAPERRTALVTGANRGLGLETAVQLQEKGFRVIVTSRDEKKGIAASQKLDPKGGDVLYHQLDITDRGSITDLAKDLPGLASRFDVLVNNAGIGSWGADQRASIRTIETNYFGSRDVTDALLPFIPNGGRIVMVSSGLGELSTLGRDLRPQFADPSLTPPALDSLVSSYLASPAAGGG